MRRVLRVTSLTAALLAPMALAPAASAQVRIQFQWGTRDRPLTGERYEAMRALAHELDGRAQHALDEVNANVGRSRRERKLLGSINDFARRAAGFHERMDSYTSRPWDLPPEVSDLRARAYRVNQSFRSVPVFEHVVDDWDAALDVLNRMQAVLQGQDVPVPQPHRYDNDRDYDQHERGYMQYQQGGREYEQGDDRNGRRGEFGGSGQPTLLPRESNVDEVRDLAGQLVNRAARARDEAGHWEDPFGDGHARDLGHFVDLARQLQQLLGSGYSDPARVRPLVEHLVNDARMADAHIRSTRGLEDARGDWTEVVRLTTRLDQLTR